MPTPVLLQSVFKSAGAVTSSTLAYTNPVSANSMCVAYLLCGGVTGVTLAVSDNVNGAYNSDVQLAHSTSAFGGIFTFPGAVAGTTTVTFTQTSGASQLRVLLEEWSNVLTSSPLDQTASSDNPIGTTSFLTGTTGTTTQNNELILACMFQVSGTTPSAYPGGFTSDTPSGLSKIYPCYRTGAPIGTYGGTYTLPTSDQGPGLIATYKTGGSSSSYYLSNYVEF